MYLPDSRTACAPANKVPLHVAIADMATRNVMAFEKVSPTTLAAKSTANVSEPLISSNGMAVKYEMLIHTYDNETMITPVGIARGIVFDGSRTSPAAKLREFQPLNENRQLVNASTQFPGFCEVPTNELLRAS